MKTPELWPLGDQAFVLRAEPVIAPDVNARVLAWSQALDREAPAWLVDRVPSYAALVVIYDCTIADADEVATALRRIAAMPGTPDVGAALPSTPGSLRRIPVWYDPAVAPDLEAVAREKGLSVDDVIAIHCATEYRVYMLGFRPGFPYMGIVDARLEMPRLPSPRLAVDAGAVAIAGRQTGIYPIRGPGGWRVLGRTPRSIGLPPLFEPGDRVRFEPIDRLCYEELLDANRLECRRG